MAWRMSRIMAWCAGLALLGALAGCGQQAAGGSWGRAIEVPGLGALNKGDGWVSSVSCAAPGNCAAGGGYTDRRSNFQGFAASQTGQGG
jgi:hypothetical protein